MIIKLANRPSLVLMVGPFFLLLTLLIAIFHLGAGALYLPLLCAVGLSCIAFFAHRGLYFAWGITAALMPFYHSPWEVGAAISISVGLWIAHLAIGQFENDLTAKTSAKSARETELAEKLQVIQEQFEVASLETERWLRQCRLQKSDGEEMLSDLKALRNKVEQQRKELNEVRTARLEASIEAKSYLSALKNAQEELICLEEQLKEASEAGRRLRQLQEQFEERNEVIHQVRKELWQSESQALYFKGLSWEEERSCDPTHEALVADLSVYEEKEQELEKEKAALEMLVSSLISELKGRSVPSFARR